MHDIVRKYIYCPWLWVDIKKHTVLFFYLIHSMNKDDLVNNDLIHLIHVLVIFSCFPEWFFLTSYILITLYWKIIAILDEIDNQKMKIVKILWNLCLYLVDYHCHIQLDSLQFVKNSHLDICHHDFKSPILIHL